MYNAVFSRVRKAAREPSAQKNRAKKQNNKQQERREGQETRCKEKLNQGTLEQRRRTASPKGPVRQCARGGLAINPFFPHLRIGICARARRCLLRLPPTLPRTAPRAQRPRDWKGVPIGVPNARVCIAHGMAAELAKRQSASFGSRQAPGTGGTRIALILGAVARLPGKRNLVKPASSVAPPLHFNNSAFPHLGLSFLLSCAASREMGRW